MQVPVKEPAHRGIMTALRIGLEDEIYITLDEAKRRLSDPPQSCAVEVPAALLRYATKPTAVLARQIASPNYEMLWFTRLARRHGFQALVIEHTSDRFTTHNPVKLALVRPVIAAGRSRTGQPILRRHKLLSPAAIQGQRLDEINLATGESLVAYHHRKLIQVMGDDAPEIVDLRHVLPERSGSPSDYYPAFFQLLRRNLVLFEDFVVDDQTAVFFRDRVHPAWRQATTHLGARPQIVRLGPERRTSSSLWSAYPASMVLEPIMPEHLQSKDRAHPTAELRVP